MRLGRHRLRGKRVAILASDGFEYVELVVPKKALELAGAETEVVSLHEGKIRGMNVIEPTRAVKVDCILENADPTRYHALFIPGGFIGPDFIRQSRQARAFVRAFDGASKPIATLCHGPWLLVSAELVSGRVLASWPGIRDDIVHAGGTWRDEPVVVDRNWVSSRSPSDLPAFIRTMTDVFAESGDHEAPSEPELPEVPEVLDEPLERIDLSSPKHDLPPPLVARPHLRHRTRTLFAFLGVALVVGLGVVVLRRTEA